MKWIGLTGGIACGKSTVADLLRKNKFHVVDADRIVHELMKTGSIAYNQILQVFGPEIVQLDQSLDRRKLGQTVFAQPQKLAQLEAILHPAVRLEVAALRATLEEQGEKVAIYDVPLLFEKQMQKDFDAIICVTATPELQTQRMRERNHWSEAEIQSRLKAQIPLSEKEKQSTYVIRNTGSLSELEQAVTRLSHKLAP